MTTTSTRTDRPTLRELQERITRTNEALGWYEDARTRGEDLALIHSEISEALEAFRDHGYADATVPLNLDDPGCLSCGRDNRNGTHDALRATGHLAHAFRPPLPKPEGVGAELADVVIRLLDTVGRWHGGTADEPYYLDLFLGDVIPYVLPMRTFGDKIAKAHQVTAREDFELLLRLLLAIADDAEVDLEREVVRKMEFNATRPHRHGGKRL